MDTQRDAAVLRHGAGAPAGPFGVPCHLPPCAADLGQRPPAALAGSAHGVRLPGQPGPPRACGTPRCLGVRGRAGLDTPGAGLGRPVRRLRAGAADLAQPTRHPVAHTRGQPQGHGRAAPGRAVHVQRRSGAGHGHAAERAAALARPAAAIPVAAGPWVRPWRLVPGGGPLRAVHRGLHAAGPGRLAAAAQRAARWSGHGAGRLGGGRAHAGAAGADDHPMARGGDGPRRADPAAAVAGQLAQRRQTHAAAGTTRRAAGGATRRRGTGHQHPHSQRPELSPAAR